MNGGFGHEIGEFLHDRSIKLYNWDDVIEDGRWVLEVLIYDKGINRTAFYEDVLMVK